ncbi:type VI secretion system tip protein VgrG [Pseudomonas sp. GD03860]|uniref:type VI secretion system Vgr family protein n=1 Tax=Pseudomonas TaxID=286 RepID=UPI0023631E32|nr:MULTISPECIES: type VI secretion system tip protein TssI/VgrG [Pseudomonas]MDD2058590.1 type VI secretion system tip protein VgrG [Pseudomonas putida]MDH0639545.1 type VI secretion system tip protein VgrG [Pseudomonas sp. GD03860]
MAGSSRCSFSGPAGAQALLFAGLVGEEGLGQLFEYKVKVLSLDATLSADDWLGKPLGVSLPYAAQGPLSRHLHAHVCSFRMLADEGRMYAYEMLLRPWLWFATCVSDCRIFQNQSVIEVLKAIFSKYPGEVQWATIETYQPLEYCVQYGETDFAFVSRLMEAAGLYYFFRHKADGHVLVIADASAAHDSIEVNAPMQWRAGDDGLFDSLWNWTAQSHLYSGRDSAVDFDFTKANTRDASVQRAEARLALKHVQGEFEHYRYPGHFANVAEGEAASKIQLRARHAEQHLFEASGCAPYLLPGAHFKLVEHPDDGQNGTYLIVRAHLQAHCAPSTTGVGSPYFSCQVQAIRSSTRYFAAVRTPRPKIVGPQTAFVVGKQGEPLWVDEFGRIKVQFHWDRGNQINENCSCWVRVAQPLAGQRWGAIFLPRVGQEVLVEFLDGDPDRPVVTGSLYNGGMRPPYPLPAQVARSGIKSQSLGAEDIYNELRFEDKGGAEQLLFHAGRNQDVTVRNDALETIGNDHHLKIGASAFCQVGKDAHEQVGGNCHRRIDGEHSLEIGADHMCSVAGGYSLDVGAELNAKVQGACSLDLGGNCDTKVGGKYKVGAKGIDLKGQQNVTLQAGTTLTLKAGANTLVLGPAGVAINGSLVTINAKGLVNINGGGGAKAASAEAPKTTSPKKAKQPQAPKEADDGRS